MPSDASYTPGAPAPLFDRLVDLDPREPVELRPRRWLDEGGLRASIREELLRLLNTRLDTPEDVWLSGTLTVLDYGIPDFSGWYAGSVEDRRRLERNVLRAIRSFEPRLEAPTVGATPSETARDVVDLSIRGEVVVGVARTPVTFPIALDARPGRAPERP